MKSTFRTTVFYSHSYVADYSEYSRINGIYPVRSVEVTDQEPPIEHFTLHNPKGLEHTAANIEHYPSFTQAENCEAVLFSNSDCARPWAILVELKYCSPHDTEPLTVGQNILRNGSKALSQVLTTADTLRRCTNIDRYNIYANVALMGLDIDEPYTAWWLSPSDLEEIKQQHHITLLSHQTVRTLHPHLLIAIPKKRHR